VRRRSGTTTRKKSAKKRQLGKYKSGLERDCANLLRENKLDFYYEEKEYIIVEKFKYNGVYHKMTSKKKDLTNRSNSVVLPIKYTPDFVAKDGSWIIETKGYLPSHHDFPMRWKLFLKYLTETESTLPHVFICKNMHQVQQAIEVIKNEKGIKG